MYQAKSRPLPPIRVRREPPTLDEAVLAAQGLTSDLDQQVAITAGLMGLAEDEVRPQVRQAAPLGSEAERSGQRIGRRPATRTPVVVVKRTARRPEQPGHPLARSR